jgi:putative transposase
MRGPVVYYVLFFIHIQTRRVHLAGITPNPDSAWMAQQARNLSMFFAEQGEFKPTHIIRDRDAKFTAQFCSILESEGIEFRPTPPRSPNLNPFSEAWVQRTKHEVLNHFLVFGERHLCYIQKIG